jgi:IS5 family transposase
LTIQRSFSDLEYATKKRVMRRDRFLGEINAVRPWPALLAEIEPFHPKGEGRGPEPGSGAGCHHHCRAHLVLVEQIVQ